MTSELMALETAIIMDPYLANDPGIADEEAKRHPRQRSSLGLQSRDIFSLTANCGLSEMNRREESYQYYYILCCCLIMPVTSCKVRCTKLTQLETGPFLQL